MARAPRSQDRQQEDPGARRMEPRCHGGLSDGPAISWVNHDIMGAGTASGLGDITS